MDQLAVILIQLSSQIVLLKMIVSPGILGDAWQQIRLKAIGFKKTFVHYGSSVDPKRCSFYWYFASRCASRSELEITTSRNEANACPGWRLAETTGRKQCGVVGAAPFLSREWDNAEMPRRVEWRQWLVALGSDSRKQGAWWCRER